MIARPPRTRKDLTELYRIAIEEYRFEVRLNWDRMQYYAVVNSAIIAVAATLVKDAQSQATFVLAATVFGIGFCLAMIGIVAIHRGRDYYQETILKKTVYEQLLGLNVPVLGHLNPKATLAIGTTAGMQETTKILAGKPRTPFFKRLVRNRLLSYFIWLLILLAVVDLAGITYAVQRSIGRTPPPQKVASCAINLACPTANTPPATQPPASVTSVVPAPPPSAHPTQRGRGT